MKRNRLGRRGGLPRDAEQLLWLASGLAESSSRAEDHFWDQRLAAAVDGLLRAEDEDTLNTALDHLSSTNAAAYDATVDDGAKITTKIGQLAAAGIIARDGV